MSIFKNKKWVFLSLSLFLVNSLFAADDLHPDQNENDCVAFAGKWLRPCLRLAPTLQSVMGYIPPQCAEYGAYQCVERAEFQKTAVKAKTQNLDLKRYPISPQVLQDMKAYNDIQAQCISDASFNTKKCTVADSSSEKNSGYHYNQKSGIINSTLSTIGCAEQSAICGIQRLLFSTKTAEHQYRLIVDAIEMKSRNLNSCQKACLVKCATATAIKYKSGMSNKASSAQSLFCNREGECTEFSRAATRLGENAKIPVKEGSTSDHAFNKFKINGQWYFGEPQSSKCEFFHTDETMKAYKEEFAHQGKSFDGSPVEITTLKDKNGKVLDENRSDVKTLGGEKH